MPAPMRSNPSRLRSVSSTSGSISTASAKGLKIRRLFKGST
jgi:hypothetical protein